METPLNASATTAGSLFSSSTFSVPPFQREYAWTADQVEEFWSDLSGAVEDQAYFLGLVILTGDDGKKQVVDGQQRMITLSILAAALRQEALRVGRKALADRIKSTFLDSIDYSTDAIRPRVSLSNPLDDATFRQIITNPESVSTEFSDDDLNLSKNLVATYRQLSLRLKKHLEIDPFKMLGLWAEFLTNRLYFAVFVHGDPSSAYRVFEVINTRGLELTTDDLLKNYVLEHTEEDSRTALYESWQGMADELNSAEPNAFVQFIRHVIMLNAGYILPRDLYDYVAGRTMRNARVNPPPALTELVTSLVEWKSFYLQLIDQTTAGNSEVEWLKVFGAVSELNVVSVRPLLMAISRAENSTEGMRALLRLLVHRMVVGSLSTGSIERRFAETARKIFSSHKWKDELDELKNLDSKEQDFAMQLITRSLNKNTLDFLRRSILQSSMTPVQDGTLHLVRPKQASEWADFTNEEFAQWGLTIGNTFLAGVERRPKGVNTWTDFKELLLTQPAKYEDPMPLTEYSMWDPTTVLEESERLSEIAISVWYG